MNFKWIAAIVLAALAVGAVTTQIMLLQMQPIAHGSTISSFGETGVCADFEPRGETERCVNVPYESEAPVSIGFSLRNTGRFPLTVRSIDNLHAGSSIAIAELYPFLPEEGELYSIDGARPFEPFSIAAGDEVTIQFMGSTRDCEVLRGHWIPGSAIGFETVRLNVRWLLLNTDVEIPLRQMLQIEAPDGSRCE